MSSSKPPPGIPPKLSTSFLSPLTENLSFHQSPEAFLTARILQHHRANPQQVSDRAAVRATILNRDVVVVSADTQVRAVLNKGTDESVDGFVAVDPYRRLMDEFFPGPNLLLQDGCPHRKTRDRWEAMRKELDSLGNVDRLREVTVETLEKAPIDSPIDLYDWLKNLAWRIHLSNFLNLSESDPLFAEVVDLQEKLLRGQFSLFPVSVNVGLWHSPRKIGIDARKKLQRIISERLKSRSSIWMTMAIEAGLPEDEVINHTLMATSSLAVKGFASLMLALLLNLFVYRAPKQSPQSLSEELQSRSSEDRTRHLNAILNETLRLSPPIAGVMRRATEDQTLPVDQDSKPNVLIPKGFDSWCYFVGSNRDPSVFGPDTDLFISDRFLGECPEPVAFGAGQKRCFGEAFVRMASLVVYDAFVRCRISVCGDVEAAGVKAWLGWEIAPPAAWAEDIKQLPTQRPARTLRMTFKRSGPSE